MRRILSFDAPLVAQKIRWLGKLEQTDHVQRRRHERMWIRRKVSLAWIPNFAERWLIGFCSNTVLFHLSTQSHNYHLCDYRYNPQQHRSTRLSVSLLPEQQWRSIRRIIYTFRRCDRRLCRDLQLWDFGDQFCRGRRRMRQLWFGVRRKVWGLDYFSDPSRCFSLLCSDRLIAHYLWYFFGSLSWVLRVCGIYVFGFFGNTSGYICSLCRTYFLVSSSVLQEFKQQPKFANRSLDLKALTPLTIVALVAQESRVRLPQWSIGCVAYLHVAFRALIPFVTSERKDRKIRRRSSSLIGASL